MKDRDSEPADDARTEDTGNGSCDGETVISVECGLNKAVLHLDQLCQGSKGACILFDDSWMTPNEFQAVSGRETAKDWKRSIKHYDKSIKLLMIKGFFSTDPAVCSCNYCTGIDAPPSPPPPPTVSVTKKTRHKNVPANDGDNAIGVTRHPSKNGRKKRTKSKAPVAKQLRKRTPTISRRNSERSSPITSAGTIAKVGRRRATHTASGSTHAVSDNEAGKSATEVDDDDDTGQESSTDGAEDSLTLADVRKGLGVEYNEAGTAPIIDDAPPATVTPAKSKCGRKTRTKKEKSPSIDETALDSDVSSSGDTIVVTTIIENSDKKKKAPDTKCTELVVGGVTIESRVIFDEEKPANVTSLQLTAESLGISKGSESTILNETTSLTGDESDSRNLETELEKGAPVENDTGINTRTPPVDVSCHKDGVTSAEEKQSAQIEANNADKSPSAIGCCAPEEQVIGATAAAPRANKTAKETEPSQPGKGKTGFAPLAAMPTPGDADSAIDTEDECAHGDANLPGEERSNGATSAKEQTQTDDDTDQDVTDVAPSENRVEILSPKREARLRCIIQELKTYKQRLVTTIEAKKRTPIADHSPMDDEVTLTRLSNGYTHGCSSATDVFREVKPNYPSLDSPPASSSPLQLLFEPTVHPVSFVAKHLTDVTSCVPGKRKRHGNRRHVSYLIPREDLLSPRSTTLNHTVKCNGDQTSTDSYCLELPTMKADATETEHFTSTPDTLPRCTVVRSYGIGDSVANDKYLLKVPTRCGADVVSVASSEHSATVSLLDLSAQKRKLSEKLPEVSQKKQRVSWPTTAPSDVSHVAYRPASNGANKSFVTSISRVRSMSAVSLCDGRRAGRSRSDPHSAPLSKTITANYGSRSTRRPHISSWSADDVFAFVLSTPHASIYAKEFMEHRITGRVLQNMTAIQMMRILRIGEHAARAVRATVEKLLGMTSALMQSVRR